MINTKLTRKVLITGGGSGIGAAIAKEFSDNEYEVIIYKIDILYLKNDIKKLKNYYRS